MKYYAIYKGFKTGVFTSWDICKSYINRFKGAKYKSFKTLHEAEYFVKYGKSKPLQTLDQYDKLFNLENNLRKTHKKEQLKKSQKISKIILKIVFSKILFSFFIHFSFLARPRKTFPGQVGKQFFFSLPKQFFFFYFAFFTFGPTP